ncbi:hypothetical protein [uncultured Draconibacterium sp.]|uniref:hypothetical protein n=1 Tax=uncultured Draconibacterium sp. TaxID=1573823 RepID=UPI003216F400
MKAIVIIIFFTAMVLGSSAQWADRDLSPQKHFLYTSGDYVMGQNNGGNLGLSYIYNDKYSISIGYSATNKVEQSLPSEYLKSAEALTPINDDMPFKNFEDLHIMVGRVINLNASSTMRLLLQGGPGISNYREPIFNVSGDQYYHSTQTTKKLCFIVNPKLELPLSCTLGFSVGPMYVVNNAQSYFGLGVGLMYGVLRNSKI